LSVHAYAAELRASLQAIVHRFPDLFAQWHKNALEALKSNARQASGTIQKDARRAGNFDLHPPSRLRGPRGGKKDVSDT